MKQNFIEHNIIILSKQTLDLFLKQDNPADLIALYCFYYYTAKWQGTNQPKATTDYAAKGLKRGLDKSDPNALSANNINALSAGSKMLATPSVAGTDIQFLLHKFKSVNPAYERLFKNTTERASLTRLVTKYGVEKVGRTIDALSMTNAEQYAPTITTPYQLEKNLGRLIAFVQKQRGKTPLAVRI